MRFFTFLIIATITPALPTSLWASELPPADGLPAGTVCAQMEAAGRRLLSGQPDDFFFIETAGIEFPVPSFAVIASPERSFDNEIIIESLPFSPSSQAEKTRQSKNWCDWDILAHVGPLARLYEMYEESGGKKEFIQNVEKLYQAGSMRVALLSKPRIGDKRVVTAWNNDGFIMFFTKDTDQTYWLIRLAAKLSDKE